MLIVYRSLQTAGYELVTKLLHRGKWSRSDFTLSFVVRDRGTLFCLCCRVITYFNQGLHHIVKCIDIIVKEHQYGLVLIVGILRANLLGSAGKITIHNTVVSLPIKYKEIYFYTSLIQAVLLSGWKLGYHCTRQQ